MEPDGDIYLKLFGHHPAGVAAEFRYGRIVNEARGDVRRTSQRHVWKCCGIDREHRDPEAFHDSADDVAIGQRRGLEERTNPHCAVEHAGLHSVQHTTRLGLLFPCRRHQTQPTVLQLDRGVDHVIADGRIGSIPHHPSNAICSDGFIEQTRGR